jgi:hypothetical protein
VESTPRRIGALAAAVVAAITLFGVVGAPPAQSWNPGGALAYRGCGANAVVSSPNWAYTQKHSGNCAGPLGVAMRRSNGYQNQRFGSSSYASTSGGSGNVGGVHWGCPSCNQTWT